MPSVEGCPQPRRRGRKVCLVGMKTGVRFGEAWKRNLCKAQSTDKRGAGLEFCQASSLPPRLRRQRLAHVPPALAIHRRPALLCV